MSTDADPRAPEEIADHGQNLHAEEVPAEAIREELPMAEATAPEEEALPPALSGRALLRRGFIRWVVTGLMRVGYRRWTRIAVVLFPENSRRAALATAVGIPLPDRLNMSWITPSLAVGGRVQNEDIERLAATGITRVVDTRAEHQDDAAALGAAHIELLALPTVDTFPLTIEQLQTGAAWVNRQIDEGQRVLIHCEHGVGRSVLLTAAALVAAGMSADDALHLIRRRRWQAAPNHRQIKRLQEFEKAVRSEQLTSAH